MYAKADLMVFQQDNEIRCVTNLAACYCQVRVQYPCNAVICHKQINPDTPRHLSALHASFHEKEIIHDNIRVFIVVFQLTELYHVNSLCVVQVIRRVAAFHRNIFGRCQISLLYSKKVWENTLPSK